MFKSAEFLRFRLKPKTPQESEEDEPDASGSEEKTYPHVSFQSPTEVIHLEYDVNDPPPPPSSDWTRFICISDTHSRSFPVPPGDVLLHSGDLTNTGTLQDFEKTMNWINGLPHKTKIIIAGNHDLTLHEGWYDENFHRWHSGRKQKTSTIRELVKGKKAQKAGVVYLEDAEHSFQAKPNGRTWTVYGSPWSPEFFNWAFNYEREDGKELVSKFPQADILLTHGPPYQIFDRTNMGDFAGCEALAERLPQLRPRIHLFGHIHEGHGAHIHSWPPNAEHSPTIQVVESDSGKDMPPFEADYNEPGHPSDKPVDESLARTVFVNAANWPSGSRARWQGKRTFGGTGFLPVIVDLKD